MYKINIKYQNTTNITLYTNKRSSLQNNNNTLKLSAQ